MTDATEAAKAAAHAASVNAKKAAKAVNDHTAPAADNVKAAAPPKRSRAELQQDTIRARAELAAALDAIEDKLNVPKRISGAAERGTAAVRTLAAENPVALGAIAVAAGAAVGLGVWAIVRAVSR